MKTIFEEKDIKCGMYVIKNTSPEDSDDYSFAMSVMYKIGFVEGAERGDKQRYCFISLTDGMVTPYKTMKEIVDRLNTGFRVLTIIEMTDILRKEYIQRIE